jgi:hypothetical protein
MFRIQWWDDLFQIFHIHPMWLELWLGPEKTSDMNETLNHQDKHQHIWVVFMIALLYYEYPEFRRIPGDWMWLWNDHTHLSHLTSPWHIIIDSHVHSLVPGFRRASTFVRPGVVRFQRVTFGGFSNQHWEYSQGKIGSWWYWCLNGWCFGTFVNFCNFQLDLGSDKHFFFRGV